MEVVANTGIIKPKALACHNIIPFEMIGLMSLDISQYFTLTFDFDKFNWGYPSSAFWPYNLRRGYWNERFKGKINKKKTTIRRCHPYYNLAFMNVFHKTKEQQNPMAVPLEIKKRPSFVKLGVPHCTYPMAVKIAIAASTSRGLTTNEICIWLAENLRIFKDYEVKRASVVSELRQSRRGTQYFCDKGRWKLKKYINDPAHNYHIISDDSLFLAAVKGSSSPLRMEYSYPIWRFC